MTDAENLAELDALSADRPRRVVDVAAAALVATIVDEDLAARRARFADRHAAERQRVQAELEKERSRAWWQAWEQRRSGKVQSIRRAAWIR